MPAYLAQGIEETRQRRQGEADIEPKDKPGEFLDQRQQRICLFGRRGELPVQSGCRQEIARQLLRNVLLSNAAD